MKQNIFLGIDVELAGFDKQPSSIAVSDLLSDFETALPAAETDVRGRNGAGDVRAELWLISEGAPVIRFSRDVLDSDTSNRDFASDAEVLNELDQWFGTDETTEPVSFFSLFRDVADYFKPLDTSLSSWNTDSLLNGDQFPLSVQGIVGISAMMVNTTRDLDITPHILRCSLVAATNSLARNATIWAAGPEGAEESAFDGWHSRGTVLVRAAGKISVASRALTPLETNLHLLSMDVAKIVPALQQTLRQDRIHGLVQQEKNKAAELDLLRKRKQLEEEQRNIDAKIAEARRAIDLERQKDKAHRGQRLVAWGSAAAFMLTVVALLPAFGALKKEDIQALVGVTGHAWGATLVGVGLAFLVFAAGALVNRYLPNKAIENSISALENEIEGHNTKLASISAGAEDSEAKTTESDPVPNRTETVGEGTPVQVATPARFPDAKTAVPTPRGRRAAPQPADPSATAESDPVLPLPSGPSTHAGPVFQIRVNVGAMARGRQSGNTFVVERESYAREQNQGSITDLAKKLRAELIREGILVGVDGKPTYQFTRSYTFDSMSTAAAVILARGVSGDDEWTELRTANKTSLKEDTDLSARVLTAPEEVTSKVPVSLRIRRTNIHARGLFDQDSGRLTVLAGSSVSMTSRDSLPFSSQMDRKNALRVGDLHQDSDGQVLRFTKDSTFSSPSKAAEVIAGYSVNGRRIWTVEETGEALENLASMDQVPAPQSSAMVPVDHELTLSGPDGVSARGRVDQEGQLVVMAKSRARLAEVESIPGRVSKKRAELIADGLLEDAGDAYILKTDYTFSSPSMAAAVLLGRSASGNLAWRAGNRTLGELVKA